MQPVFDSHCHIDMVLSRGVGEQQVIDTMRDNGVDGFTLIAADAAAIDYAVDYVQQDHPFRVCYTIGLHPGEAHEVDTSLCANRARELREDADFRAIGEIGLDYYYGAEHKKEQNDAFAAYLDLALELKKPICIHTRDAHEDTISQLRKVVDELPVLIHCFTGDRRQMDDYLAMGCSISFSGIVTFKNAKELQQAALHCPLERMLVETDAPYLTPTPHRGKPNHPGMVRHTARFIADLKGVTEDEVAAATHENTFNFYGLE